MTHPRTTRAHRTPKDPPRTHQEHQDPQGCHAFYHAMHAARPPRIRCPGCTPRALCVHSASACHAHHASMRPSPLPQVDPQALMGLQQRISQQVQGTYGVTDEEVPRHSIRFHAALRCSICSECSPDAPDSPYSPGLTSHAPGDGGGGGLQRQDRPGLQGHPGTHRQHAQQLARVSSPLACAARHVPVVGDFGGASESRLPSHADPRPTPDD